MNRIELIQSLINKASFTTYLEIGTQSGDSFLPIVCSNKIAIDPDFGIKPFKKFLWNFKNPVNKKNRYFEMTSDDFFAKIESDKTVLQSIDISLVDGMHLFAYSLRDVLNCLKHLSKGGIIIMHDCLPPTELAAKPIDYTTPEGWSELKSIKGAWCGDVWKTVYYLKEYHSDILEAFVIDTDFGLGIIMPKADFKNPPKIDRVKFNNVNHLLYSDMISDTKRFIDLKQADYCSKLIDMF